MAHALRFASLAALALAAGCQSLNTPEQRTAAPAELAYAHGFADHVSAVGEDLARELALYRARREAAQLQTVRGIDFTYGRLGDPRSLKIDFVGQAEVEEAGVKTMGDSLWLAARVRRTPDVVTLMAGMPVARGSGEARDTQLARAYDQARRAALAQAIEAFAGRSIETLAGPLRGKLTIVSQDVALGRFGGLRVTVEANAEFAAEGPEAEELSLEQARRLRAAGDKQAAAALMRELIRRTPTVAQYYEELGNIYCDMHEFARARWQYGMAATFDPANPEYHLAMGEACQFMGDHREAERAYARALELDPTCAAAATALKLLRQRSGAGDAGR